MAAEPTPEPTAEPAPEPTAEPTEEPEDGAIGSTTATGDNAGGLVIAWQAPQAPHDAPTDYRVNWARSDDAYPAYTEEHGNAHPATPTHTIEGLDRDTKYKIRIRARYSPNGQYDAHWSGPWTEITARVVSSPPDTRKKSDAPAAPTLIGTAVTPEGHVTLLWLDPSDDSDHRIPGAARPGRRLAGRHPGGYRLNRDHLHRHGGRGGTDPRLRGAGPQRRRAEPDVQHPHGDRATERGRGRAGSGATADRHHPGNKPGPASDRAADYVQCRRWDHDCGDLFHHCPRRRRGALRAQRHPSS